MMAGDKMAMWSDGSVTKGRTWIEVEDNLRYGQRWDKYEDRLEFREEMAHRAFVWSETTITLDELAGSSYKFLRALERAGMIRMEVVK